MSRLTEQVGFIYVCINIVTNINNNNKEKRPLILEGLKGVNDKD